MNCIQKFKESSGNFLLFLSSVVVLEETQTLRALMSQNLNIVAPKLVTNHYPAKIERYCDMGWGRYNQELVNFPVKGTLKNIDGKDYRYKVNITRVIHLF